MKKEIAEINAQRINLLVKELTGIENKIPHVFKTAFNFKGRKSPDIAKQAISTLSDKGDLVFDPFMGSASFVIGSVLADRKIVATEIDNYTYYAVYALLSKSDDKVLNNMFRTLESNIKSEVMDLYKTSCCGVKNYISKLLFDPVSQEFFDPTPNREIVDGKNIKLIAKCPICGERQKKFDLEDLDVLHYVDSLDTSNFPKNKYITNSRINITESTGANYYDRIFTNRNKKALLMIQEEINKLNPSIERDIIEQALVSALSLSRIAMYGSSTDILYHVVPYGAQEMNVWELFESKFKSFLAFKELYKEVLTNNPTNNEKYQILLSSYQEYCDNTSKQFDLIYTDFPYTDQVPYLERNQLYRIWLENFYDSNKYKLTTKMLKEEIVQSDAPSRKEKNLENYYNDIDKMFASFNKVSKPNGLVVLTVKLGKNKYFSTLIEIINLARKNGFEYATRIGIDKDDPSLRKQSAYKNTLSKEMIIIFEKLNDDNRYWYINNKNYEFETVKALYSKLNSSKVDINISQAITYVTEYIRKKENHITTEDDVIKIEQIIRNNFIVETQNAVVRIDSNRLYLDIEDKTDLFTKLYNCVPIYINKLLEANGSFVLDDLYFEIANSLCEGNPETINQFLEDSSHQKGIERLLNAYCSVNGKSYERKVHTVTQNRTSIDISILSGTDFEVLITKLLEAEGYHDILPTGGSGDLGVDILAKKKDSIGVDQLYLFQCKRWVSDVGSEPMQRLVSERARRNADVAICVTTSGYTPDGLKISQEQEVGAWDGKTVIEKLELHFPNMYYNSILDSE